MLINLVQIVLTSTFIARWNLLATRTSNVNQFVHIKSVHNIPSNVATTTRYIYRTDQSTTRPRRRRRIWSGVANVTLTLIHQSRQVSSTELSCRHVAIVGTDHEESYCYNHYSYHSTSHLFLFQRFVMKFYGVIVLVWR